MIALRTIVMARKVRSSNTLARSSNGLARSSIALAHDRDGALQGAAQAAGAAASVRGRQVQYIRIFAVNNLSKPLLLTLSADGSGTVTIR